MLKCFFKNFASLRPAALLKRDSSTGVFSIRLRYFLEHLFCIWLSYVYIQKGVLKNPAKLTAKFMWTTAPGISENRLLLDRLQIYSCFGELAVSQYLRYWVFPLRCSLQLILHWWAPNQWVKVDNSTQMITEEDLDIQAAARGKPGTKSVWLTSLNTVSAPSFVIV